MRIFRVWFQYQEQGCPPFSIRFEATDADHAMEVGRLYACASLREGLGDFQPVSAEPAHSMTERDLDAFDAITRFRMATQR